MSIRRVLTISARVAFVFAGIVLATLLAEGAARLRDGKQLFSRRLVAAAPPSSLAPTLLALDPEGDRPLPADVHGEWLANPPPPPPPRAPDRMLVKLDAAAKRNGLRGFEAFRIWNAEVVRRHGCNPRFKLLRQLPQPLRVFDPPQPGRDEPPYRYMSGASMPGGLVTNRFGFRGPEVPIDKPPATIRVAFVGASTTVGLWQLPWSYPELVVHWLNVWATENGLAIRFDGINAGREGIPSGSIEAITAQEVLPFEPDIVVYYEGESVAVHVAGA